jgi:hypothetical protein
MPYVTVPGLKGQVFVPGKQDRRKKHRCPDCVMCQMCSETRCRQCRSRRRCGKRKGK